MSVNRRHTRAQMTIFTSFPDGEFAFYTAALLNLSFPVCSWNRSDVMFAYIHNIHNLNHHTTNHCHTPSWNSETEFGLTRDLTFRQRSLHLPLKPSDTDADTLTTYYGWLSKYPSPTRISRTRPHGGASQSHGTRGRGTQWAGKQSTTVRTCVCL